MIDGPAPEVSLRPAVAGDLPRMAAIAVEAYARYVPRLDGREPPAMRPDFARFVGIGVGDGVAWVAEAPPARQPALPPPSAQDLLAYCLACPDGGPPGGEGPAGWEIHNLAVDPAAQGMGLGRRLIATAEAEGRARGFAVLRLLTNVVMVENRALYARLGYRALGERAYRGTRVIDFEKAL
ncbi:MAG: GNAT family N-acetyltransferase [Pseudomonadota bacterium]